ATSIQQTRDGGYVVAGHTQSFGAGRYDPWILKLDKNGKVLWQKSYGGGYDDYAYSIQQTSDGGYVIAGNTYSFGAGSRNFWVLKLNSIGNIVWQKTYGGSKFDHAESIYQTNDGGYVVAGRTDSFGAGNYDFWVLKLDSIGNIVWQKTYGGSSFDHASSIQQTSDGGYVVAGWSFFLGAGNYDFWVLKLDNNGNMLWQKAYDSSDSDSDHDYAESIQQTSDGGYVVAGWTDPPGAGNPFSFDILVLKLDRRGNIPGCNLMRNTECFIIDTMVTPINTAVSAQNTSLTSISTNVQPQDTDAIVNVLCRYEEDNGCPIKIIYADAGAHDELYTFRDEQMASIAAGQDLINLYYKHSPEVVNILMQNHWLALRSAFVLHDIMPGIRYITGNRWHSWDIYMTSYRISRIQRLFNDISEEGSQELADTMSILADELDKYRWQRISKVWADFTDASPQKLPDATMLYQNYPNPFNPETWIPYQLQKDADVNISIYDISGKLIRTLELGHKPAGYYLDNISSAYWDGRNSAGELAASGIYFYTISTGEFIDTKKMIITQ
ncbi:T9SS type A sorting domain-containing protein, partial [Candidatus Poribacteria bacterium]|nr:T9SS type A sorting domain-containing protein [Candidatus Poribacteria bacterium]